MINKKIISDPQYSNIKSQITNNLCTFRYNIFLKLS